jgi:hypothetical protein
VLAKHVEVIAVVELVGHWIIVPILLI